MINRPAVFWIAISCAAVATGCSVVLDAAALSNQYGSSAGSTNGGNGALGGAPADGGAISGSAGQPANGTSGSAGESGAGDPGGGARAMGGGGSTSVGSGPSGRNAEAGSGGTAQISGGSGSIAGFGGASGGSGECPCVAPTPTCVAGKCVVRGPDMISANGYYVDRTEVTIAQYAGFKAVAAASAQTQPAECAWNASYEPVYDPNLTSSSPNHPITDIDYCDAVAFCTWADKRLCGNIAGGGLTIGHVADVSQSQWFAACGGPKAQLYPYGIDYRSGVCNDPSRASSLSDVGAAASCNGYYPGLLDMLGNAREWLDACDGTAGANDGCEVMGGSYAVKANCTDSNLVLRSAPATDLGFRCCSK
jgi:sulfatase modifying factor 1